MEAENERSHDEKRQPALYVTDYFLCDIRHVHVHRVIGWTSTLRPMEWCPIRYMTLRVTRAAVTLDPAGSQCLEARCKQTYEVSCCHSFPSVHFTNVTYALLTLLAYFHTVLTIHLSIS
jgi:hypothetical protein